MTASTPPPSPEELQRELEQLRAAQPPEPAAVPAPASVGQLVKRRALRTVILWLVLVIAFLVIWQLFVPAR